MTGDGDTVRAQRQHRPAADAERLRQLQLRVRRDRSDRPQRAAQRCGRADRRRQHRREESGADLGLAGDPGRSQDVRQSRASTSARPASYTATATTCPRRPSAGSTTATPIPAPAVFSADNGETLLIGDLTPETMPRCPTGERSRTTFPIRPRWRRCSPIRTVSRSRRCSLAGSRRSSAATSTDYAAVAGSRAWPASGSTGM